MSNESSYTVDTSKDEPPSAEREPLFWSYETASPSDLRLVIDEEYITGALKGELARKYQTLARQDEFRRALEWRVGEFMDTTARHFYAHEVTQQYRSPRAMFSNPSSFLLFGPSFTKYAILLGSIQDINEQYNDSPVEIPFSSRFENIETRDAQRTILLGGLSMMIICLEDPNVVRQTT